MVMRRRPQSEEAIKRAVRNGLRMSRAAGVSSIGDIAGSDSAVLARLTGSEAISGVSYIEAFGFDNRATQVAASLRDRLKRLNIETPTERKVEIGVQPHAPYSAGLRLYAEVLELEVPLSTHLAETPEEVQFTRAGTGDFAEMLRRIGKWDPSAGGAWRNPVYYLEHVLDCGDWLVAHCNYVSDSEIEFLSASETRVAYCPIASDYFRHRNHRYRDMVDAGVTVCLGTDSILCQPPHEKQPLGILPQIRHLHRRDRADPQLLLELATWRGLIGLHGRKESDSAEDTGTLLKKNGFARLIAIRFDPADPTDALTQVLLNDYPVEPLTL
jgi:cytosine/adenosine deaminase-related metal-dependent hydrolase